ncbi:hypothetical protein SacglDRAFT_02353 [Saccharomonospora glauca K62]|uniref:Uncharacterized protein n=1 Tax=Saccharomonospora glauca K62 TaxID=928724 RepID=I1D2S4_9PSEU|nr:hypothetical protein SacglDRAFT_02353 [Saccharomonospora glauca K62]
MQSGDSSLVRAEIGGNLGLAGIGRCSRIAVSGKIVPDGESPVPVARNGTGHPAFGGCQTRPSGRGQVDGIGAEVAGVGVHQRPPPLR